MKAGLLRQPPSPGEWSVNGVLAHLRACSDQWGGAIHKILAEEPSFEAVNPARWIDRTDYPQQPFARSFKAFVEQRAALLAALEPLDPEGWTASSEVKVWGQVFVRSVRYYAAWLARHERPHVKQIERTLAAVLSQQT